MRIPALTKYGPLAASTRQRFLQYRPFLEANGVTLDVAPLLGNGRLARLGGGTKARGERLSARQRLSQGPAGQYPPRARL